jgi:hypothetical protein
MCIFVRFSSPFLILLMAINSPVCEFREPMEVPSPHSDKHGLRTFFEEV